MGQSTVGGLVLQNVNKDIRLTSLENQNKAQKAQIKSLNTQLQYEKQKNYLQRFTQHPLHQHHNPHYFIPVVKGRPVNLPFGTVSVLPRPTPVKMQPIPYPKMASNTLASLTRFKADPGATYNLLNDRGLVINGKTQAGPTMQGKADLNEIGMVIQGMGGYSRIHVSNRELYNGTGKPYHATLNGKPLLPGQSARLADGGLIHIAASGQSVYVKNAEGYQTNIQIHKKNQLQAQNYLQINARSPHQGVIKDGQRPGGLLGEKILGNDPLSNPDKIQKMKVAHGIHGMPPATAVYDPLPQEVQVMDLAYCHHFSPTIKPSTTTQEMTPEVIQDLWNQTNNFIMDQNTKSDAILAQNKDLQEARKQQLLLKAALMGGNIELAVLLFSMLETKQANKVSTMLLMRIQSLTQQRQNLSTQMNEIKEDAKGASQLQSLVTQSNNVGTEIAMLQTFLQDVTSSKRNDQQFASNFIKQSHETSQAIIRNIG
ncbi:MAG: hypothetical protein A3I75_02940 [Deltaproteobacteria bacterium RIFCSPLOWO2_02_FULL_50_16]|nr:MAG: hypothetical protein A3B79_06870 [Deltaproteobacteria bacterium RIFCSPHIGHO2_02_FULL_50_15]OGQ56903.1 MAG: hypothetical protein A3I75_02940 [Deltaproteobacteria bacterium RIFCSPLOWO2_02_FULL_50_16]OGQ67919.1 MAG: hypothetical protein A3F89_03300 [Deltaproteobacteria bacterium RIFCSPLOWO2_12_FULL_50_11]